MLLTLRDYLEKIKFAGEVRCNESMRLHTSFRTGGPADLYTRPAGVEELKRLAKTAAQMGLPRLLLGSGANVLAADAGIRGLVIDTGRLQNIEVQDTRIRAGAGCDISKVAEHAAEKGLSGLEFIYAMPGSVGGSVWMNARCYGISVSERLESVRYLDENLQVREMIVDAKNFGYKTSPFQDKDAVILDAVFQLAEGDPAQIRRRMEKNREDRTTKGHFRAASAGSTFKNNRDFGSPTGVLIDRLGLKGYQIGGAMVAPYHGNIIINTGNAASRDILDLIRYIERRVYERYGFSLEREVRLIGDWEARHEKSN